MKFYHFNYSVLYLKFGIEFEKQFLTQAQDQDRSIEDTLNIGWELIKLFPKEELYRIDAEYIKKYLKKDEKEG